MRQLPALAFTPPEDVVENYEKLEESEFFTSPENELLLRPLLDYFEETWVGRYDRRRQGRRQPMFDINFWNCYNACHEALPKTNNDIEGWHRRFSSLIYSYHPSIWKFIDAIRMDEKQNRKKIEELIAGHEPPAKRKCYKDTAANISRIVREYSGRNLIDYLRGIAHNLELQSIQ